MCSLTPLLGLASLMFPHTTAGLGIADVHSHRCWAWHRWLKTTGGGFDNNRLVDDRRVRSTLVLDDLTDASPHSLDGGSRAGRDDSRSAVSGAGVDDVLESRLTTAAMPGGGLASGGKPAFLGGQGPPPVGSILRGDSQEFKDAIADLVGTLAPGPLTRRRVSMRVAV